MVQFSQPVEIPGRVLPAGSYVFRLMNAPSNRNIVEILNKNQTRVDAVVLAIPDYRDQLASKPVFLFEERPVGTPVAIKAWFYPRMHYGHEFVYPNSPLLRAQAAPASSPRARG